MYTVILSKKGPASQNQNSLLVKRQTDNTTTFC